AVAHALRPFHRQALVALAWLYRRSFVQGEHGAAAKRLWRRFPCYRAKNRVCAAGPLVRRPPRSRRPLVCYLRESDHSSLQRGQHRLPELVRSARKFGRRNLVELDCSAAIVRPSFDAIDHARESGLGATAAVSGVATAQAE